jgi:hypothetical protein
MSPATMSPMLATRFHWQGIMNALDSAFEEELTGVVGQVAQHAAELMAIRDALGYIEAVRRARIGDKFEAEQPNQCRMLNEEGTQGAHGAFLLMQLDQVGSHEGGARGWLRAGPRAGGGSLRELRPVERAEERSVFLGNRAGEHKRRQWRVGLGQGLGPDAVKRAEGHDRQDGWTGPGGSLHS